MAKLMNNIIILATLNAAIIISAQAHRHFHHHDDLTPAPTSIDPYPAGFYEFANECMDKLGEYCGQEIIAKTVFFEDISYGCCDKLVNQAGMDCYKAVMNATLDELSEMSAEIKQVIRGMEELYWYECTEQLHH